MARRLRAALAARGFAATHSDTLELVAAQLGFRDWNTTSASLNTNDLDRPGFTQSIPVMLSLDETKCRAFYCDFLGFDVEFEHRFTPHMPAYLGFKRGPVELHLSPHRGDATTGSAVFVWMTGVDDYRRELACRSDGHAMPKIVDQPWGRELTFTDPFGNRLRFCERPTNSSAQGRIVLDEPAGHAASGRQISGATESFDVVRQVGTELSGVKTTTDSLGTALKLKGEILACTAIHKSAEPNSLMLRLGFDRRDALMAENPATFYLSEHYEPYPVVLVRMRQIDHDYLRALLKEGWERLQRESE